MLVEVSGALKALEHGAALTDALQVAAAHRLDLSDTDKSRTRLATRSSPRIMTSVHDSIAVDPGVTYPNVGLLSFGRGLFGKPPIDGARTSATTLYRIRAGQFIDSRLFAFEGAYAVVDEHFDGSFVSSEFPTFELDTTGCTRLSLPRTSVSPVFGKISRVAARAWAYADNGYRSKLFSITKSGSRQWSSSKRLRRRSLCRSGHRICVLRWLSASTLSARPPESRTIEAGVDDQDEAASTA